MRNTLLNTAPDLPPIQRMQFLPAVATNIALVVKRKSNTLPLLYPTFSPAFAIPQARIPEFPIDRKSTVRASVRYGQTWLVELMRYE